MQFSAIILLASVAAATEWALPVRHRSVLSPAILHFVTANEQLVQIQQSVEVAQSHYQLSEPNTNAQVNFNAKIQDSSVRNDDSAYDAKDNSEQRPRTNPSADHGTHTITGERRSDQADVKPKTIPQYIEIAQKYGAGRNSSHINRNPDEPIGSSLNSESSKNNNVRPIERISTGRPHTNVDNNVQHFSNENNKRKPIQPSTPIPTYVRIAQSVEKNLPTYQPEQNNNNERTDSNHRHKTKQETNYVNGNQRPENVPLPNSDASRPSLQHHAPAQHHSYPLPTVRTPQVIPVNNSQSAESHEAREPIDNRDKYYHRTTPDRVDQNTKPPEEKNATKVGDRWIWGMSEDVTPATAPTTEVLTVTLDDRGNFVGDKCPTHKVKIMGKCVIPD